MKYFLSQAVLFSGFCRTKVKLNIKQIIESKILFFVKYSKIYSKSLTFHEKLGPVIIQEKEKLLKKRLKN